MAAAAVISPECTAEPSASSGKWPYWQAKSACVPRQVNDGPRRRGTGSGAQNSGSAARAMAPRPWYERRRAGEQDGQCSGSGAQSLCRDSAEVRIYAPSFSAGATVRTTVATEENQPTTLPKIAFAPKRHHVLFMLIDF